jgi:hypothetical protein
MMIGRRGFLLGASTAALAMPALAAPTTAEITGGRGGRIIRVTTLKADGPGSFIEAVKAKGPRIIVFEVGGVIDLGMETVKLNNGDLTLAGQTAPSLVTFIRGGIGISTDNVVIQHVAVRPGEAGQAKTSGWECDGITAYASANVEVSNCSITWATDEGLSASGPRFIGGGPEDWQKNTSRHIRFLRNIVAEGLSNSTHSKGEHSKGTLIHDNVSDAVIADSLYAHNRERNVLFKGGAIGEMRGNVVYNAGKRFAHYNLHRNEWDRIPFAAGRVTIRDNAFIAGPSTLQDIAAFMLGGDGPMALDMAGNSARRADGSEMPPFARYGQTGPPMTIEAWPEPAAASLAPRIEQVLATCGARPEMRDPIDVRIVEDVKRGTGRIINSEQEVGGYPVRPETQAAFVETEWDLERMVRR